MATRDVQVSKKGSVRPLLTLVRGDSRTQIIRLIVDRYSGGVDLSGLAWDVVATNAAGESDIYYIVNAQVEDTVIVCDWVVRGIATSVEGETRFELEGFDRDAEGETVYTWQSGIYSINVTADLNYTPSEDEEAELSGVQELILTVTKELPTVYEARDAANQAAQDASDSATAANNAAKAALKAAEEAKDAASSGGAVKSVNGKTGAVVLDAEDVGALPKDGKAPNPYALTIRAVEHPTFAGTPAVQTIYHGGSPTQVELPSTGYVDEASKWANIGDRPFGWFGRDRSICNWGWAVGDNNITVADTDALVSICPVYDVVRLFEGYPYTVTLNGNVYECTGTVGQIEGTDGIMVDVVYIGNPANFAGEDNGMPFTFIDKCGSETLPEYFKGDAFMILMGVDNATTKVMLDIYEGKFLVKIPGEYIDFATDEEILAMMLEMDALPTLVDADGDVLIGADNTILLI